MALINSSLMKRRVNKTRIYLIQMNRNKYQQHACWLLYFIYNNWKTLISFENSYNHLPTITHTPSPTCGLVQKSNRRAMETPHFWVGTNAFSVCIARRMNTWNLTSILNSNYLLNSNNSNKNIKPNQISISNNNKTKKSALLCVCVQLLQIENSKTSDYKCSWSSRGR